MTQKTPFQQIKDLFEKASPATQDWIIEYVTAELDKADLEAERAASGTSPTNGDKI